MNNFTIFTSKKNYDFKTTSPKQCAKLFIQKYPKFNQKFSVYNHYNKKIYGFFHKNQFLQSGGVDVKMLYKKNGSNNVINNINNIKENDINALKKRNSSYTTISIPLDASLKNFENFGTLLESVNTDDKYKYLIQDFLKTIIYKLQFINDEKELEKYLNIVKQFNNNTIIKKAVEQYLPNVKNYKNIIEKLKLNSEKKTVSNKKVSKKFNIVPPTFPLKTNP